MDWNALSRDANRCYNDDTVNGVCSLLAQTNEPPRGKTNNVDSEQVRHKPTCTSTEKS